MRLTPTGDSITLCYDILQTFFLFFSICYCFYYFSLWGLNIQFFVCAIWQIIYSRAACVMLFHFYDYDSTFYYDSTFLWFFMQAYAICLPMYSYTSLVHCTSIQFVYSARLPCFHINPIVMVGPKVQIFGVNDSIYLLLLSYSMTTLTIFWCVLNSKVGVCYAVGSVVQL